LFKNVLGYNGYYSKNDLEDGLKVISFYGHSSSTPIAIVCFKNDVDSFTFFDIDQDGCQEIVCFSSFGLKDSDTAARLIVYKRINDEICIGTIPKNKRVETFASRSLTIIKYTQSTGEIYERVGWKGLDLNGLYQIEALDESLIEYIPFQMNDLLMKDPKDSDALLLQLQTISEMIQDIENGIISGIWNSAL